MCLLTEWEGWTKKYLALGQDESFRGAWSIRPDFEPNIFQSGPPTQSIYKNYHQLTRLCRTERT